MFVLPYCRFGCYAFRAGYMYSKAFLRRQVGFRSWATFHNSASCGRTSPGLVCSQAPEPTLVAGFRDAENRCVLVQPE